MMWIAGIVVAVLVSGGLALQWAIARDGPGVLTAIDRVTGGDADAVLLTTVSTGPHPQQKVLVWGPADRSRTAPALPVLVFVHGGSWRSGDPASYGFMGRAFVPKGFVVVLAGYRLGEEGAYPAMLEDTASAIGWTRREIQAYGGDPSQIVIAGHSAGAYNVVMAALDPRWLSPQDMSGDDIAGVVGLSGPYDFYPYDSDSTKAAFGKSPNPASTQPLAHLRGDAPPMLLIHGEKDTLVKPRNTRVLAEGIEKRGGKVAVRFYPDMNHNDPLISLAAPWRSRRDIADEIAEFALDASSRSAVSVPVQAQAR